MTDEERKEAYHLFHELWGWATMQPFYTKGIHNSIKSKFDRLGVLIQSKAKDYPPLSSIAEGMPDYAKMEREAWAEVERTVKACSDEYPAHVDLLISAIRQWGFAFRLSKHRPTQPPGADLRDMAAELRLIASAIDQIRESGKVK